jgi:4-hydroxy-4-methyl-2-oxoglutarate aldolase
VPDADPIAQAALALGAATLGESGARRMDPRVKPVWTGARVAGPAYTVRCSPGDNLAIHVAVTRAPADSVLVADMGGERDFGYWGEVLTTGAQARGVAGLVIDACVRDCDALGAHAFPVFSTGIALTGASKTQPGAIDRLVRVGDTAVEPGDWIVGDVDGVVVLPGADVEAVLAAGTARAATEVALFRVLRDGGSSVEEFGLDISRVDGA